MSVRLALLELRMPARLRRAGLDELAATAAGAFACPAPRLGGRTHADRLEQFARFTAGEAALACTQERDQVVRAELRREAEQLGRRLRRRLGVRSPGQALRALRLLYGQLGIDLGVPDAGKLEMTRCSFSSFYDAQVCRVMSAMDEGIVSGLTGGCRLRFERRMTEGAASCIASLAEPTA
jgi:hypothetical protein